MNWGIFFLVLGIGYAFILVAGMSALDRGWLRQRQICSRGIIGYSYLEHGGMRADTFLITPTVAYLAGSYQYPFFTRAGLSILILSCIAWYCLVRFVYQEGGKKEPEAYTHDGVTTEAGWLHGAYAALATWVLLMTYFSLVSPHISPSDLLLLSTILTFFFYWGVRKHNSQWIFKPQDKIQVGASIALVWIVTGMKLWFMKG